MTRDIDIKKIEKIHFIGIGGIGISALARMMVHEGKQVTGTNNMPSPETLGSLMESGVVIDFEKKIDAIPDDVDLIVYSLAWDLIETDFMARIRENIQVPILTYPEMLGIVSKDKYTIAVAGTHGKTTTTAMIADVMIDAGMKPTVIVGSLLSKYNSNFVPGDSKYFLVEACEYKRSFCNINPDILVITNIEEDHLDYYKDLDDIKSAFAEVAAKVPQDGYIVSNTGVPYGWGEAHRINYGDYMDNVPALKVPGNHNRENAAAALALADVLAVDLKSAEKSVSEFSGTWRRFEYKGKTSKGADVYDDYAHHPTEVRAALSAAREKFPSKKIIVAFHPHLYSRTKYFLKEFSEVLSLADDILIAPVFAARETDDGEGNAEKLAATIRSLSAQAGKARDFKTLDEVRDALLEYGDEAVIVTMGAGDIYKVADTLVTK